VSALRRVHDELGSWQSYHAALNAKAFDEAIVRDEATLERVSGKALSAKLAF